MAPWDDTGAGTLREQEGIQKAPKLTFAGPHSDDEDERGPPADGWSSSQSRVAATPKGLAPTQADAMLQAQFDIAREKQLVEVSWSDKLMTS